MKSQGENNINKNPKQTTIYTIAYVENSFYFFS